MSVNLLYFVSHPIQYQAPLLRKIASEDHIDLHVIFESDKSSRRHFDPGFGRDVDWDVDLLTGYRHSCVAEINLKDCLAAADVVWLHGWHGRVQRRVLYLAHKLKIPVLMRGENWSGAMPDGAGMRGVLKRQYLRWIFSRCSRFLAIGSANRQYYLRHGIDESRIFMMPYAVDNDFFAEQSMAANRAATCVRLGVSEEAPIVLFAGKFSPRKKPDLLLDAWCHADWPEPRPNLVYVGDGELRGELERAAPPGVVFAGFRNQSEMPAIYAAADVFVLASEREPWGLAINEAMACGTPVIASDQCGAAFDLVDENTGAIVATGDGQDLSRALVRVVAESKARGEAARDRIRNWDFGADIAGLKAAIGDVL